MSDTLNLFDCLLETAHRQAQARQITSAIRTLRRLAHYPDLSHEQSTRTHALLGELFLRRRKYRLARRHLTIAVRLDRTSARTFFLLGLACHHDPRGNHDRAAAHYTRSIQLAPRQVRCLGEAGLLAIAQGDHENGLAMLQEAVEIQPESANAIVRLCRGLCQTGQPEEALRTVRLALFRLPGSTALRSLNAEILLDRLASGQEREAATQEVEHPGPVILPFLAVVGAEETQRIRHDGPQLFRMHRQRNLRRAP